MRSPASYTASSPATEGLKGEGRALPFLRHCYCARPVPGWFSPQARGEAKELLLLAGPLIAAQIAGIASNFVDTVMAGRLGPEALGAVAVGASTWMTLTLTATGILAALSPVVAQLRGAGRRGEVALWTRQSFWIALGISVVWVALLRSMEPLLELIGVDRVLVPLIVGYLEAFSWGMPGLCGYLVLRLMSEGLALTRPAMYFGLLGTVVNALGNYALMFGHWGFPKLGVVGCGYSTAIVCWVQFLGLAAYVARRRYYSDLGLFDRFELPDPARLRELLRIGLPIGGATFTESSLFSSVAYLLATLGTLAVAAHQIAINFVAILFMIPLGLSMAITVRVGHARGRRDAAGTRRAGAIGMGIAIVIQVVSATVILLFPELIVGIYTSDPAVARRAVGLLYLAAIFQLSDGLQVSAAGALRGLKDTRVPMLITIVAYWVVGLPLGATLGLSLGYGATGMWIGLIAGLSVASVLLPWRFHRLCRSTDAAP